MTDALPVAAARVDLAVKLLRHALDSAAGDGESETAVVKFVRAARRERVTFDVLADAIGRSAEPPPRPPAGVPLPFAWFVRLGFGRFAGLTLGHVAREDFDYAKWVARKARDPDVRAAAAAVVQYVAAGGSHA